MRRNILYLSLLILFFSCNKEEPEIDTNQDNPEQIVEEPEGDLIITLTLPSDNTSDNRKLHVVLYDNNDQIIDYKTHIYGEEESLKFYSEHGMQANETFSIAFINNLNDQFYSIRLYKDLTLASLGDRIGLPSNRSPIITGNRLIDIPIIGQEERWEIRATNGGNSLIGINGRFTGNYSEYTAGTAPDSLYVQYFNVDNLYDYKYRFIRKETLKNLTELDVSTFVDSNVRSGSIAINGPNELAYLQIYGYENLDFLNADIGHRICFNPAILDFNGIYYSYADIFPYTRFILQYRNYEIETGGLIPQEVPLPDKEINYLFNSGTIAYSGLTDHEVARFYLRTQEASFQARVIILADGETTEVTVPELPDELFSAGGIENPFDIRTFEFVQAAAENYEEFDSYEDFIESTLGRGDLYYLAPIKRERIFKSSVSTSLLPF